MTPRLLIAVLPILMAGCSLPSSGDDDTGPAVPMAAAAAPVSAPIDGIYRGSGELVSGSADTCPSDAWGNVEIGDRALLFSYTPAAIFSAPITADGKVHGEADTYVLDGTFNDGELSFTVTGPSCKTSFAFNIIGGF